MGGRRNRLVASGEAAAHHTAILCSLVQTCKHLHLDPFVCLRDVIGRVSAHPARRALELTPREWTRLRQESATQAAAWGRHTSAWAACASVANVWQLATRYLSARVA